MQVECDEKEGEEWEVEWGDSGLAMGSTLEEGWGVFHSTGESRREEMEGWVKEKGPLLVGSSWGFYEEQGGSGEEWCYFWREKVEVEEKTSPLLALMTC